MQDIYVYNVKYIIQRAMALSVFFLSKSLL